MVSRGECVATSPPFWYRLVVSVAQSSSYACLTCMHADLACPERMSAALRPSTRSLAFIINRDTADLYDIICCSRCHLCNGVGTVGWEGKWAHVEACPVCLGKRHNDCNTCGGKYHRPIFFHCHRPAYTGQDPPVPLRQIVPQGA